MGKRIIVILASLALLYSFGIDKALSQVNVSPPLWPPEYVVGNATIGGQSAQGGVVYLKMAQLCVIFLDGLDDQGDITNIVNGLNATPANTLPLALAFSNSDFCKNYDPPLVLPGPATVNKLSASEWEVRDPSGRFRVFTQDIKIWQGSSWVPGYKKLQVNMYNGKIASSAISSGSSPYFLEVPVNPEGILWGGGTYTLLAPGSAMLGEAGYFYIKKDGVERRVTTVDGQEIDPHYLVGQGPFTEYDLDAPSLFTVNISLAVGWNMFSIPVVPSTGTNPSDVLDTITGLYNSVWKFNIGQGWAIYEPGGISDLNEILACEGYWIKMDQEGTLTVQGTDPDVTEKFLQGDEWNLVGYCSREERNVEAAVSSIASYINSVWGFKPDQGWQIYEPGGVSDLQVMRPGEAFWIKANVNCYWNVNQ